MYLLFDIGGTNTRFVISDGVTVGNPKIFSTPQNFEEFIANFSKWLQTLPDNTNIRAGAGGLPGVISSSQELVYSPNLPGWIGKPIKNELSRVLGSEVFLENDAALAGLGEANFGCGRDYSIIAYLTISTGVGGARIVDKMIDKKTFGFEPGHQIISIDSESNLIDLESFISGAGLMKIHGKKSEELNDSQVWTEVTKYLAIGLNNTILHWSPDLMILGGAIINKGRISITVLKDELSKILTVFPNLPVIKLSELGDIAGLYGALSLINSLSG